MLAESLAPAAAAEQQARDAIPDPGESSTRGHDISFPQGQTLQPADAPQSDHSSGGDGIESGTLGHDHNPFPPDAPGLESSTSSGGIEIDLDFGYSQNPFPDGGLELGSSSLGGGGDIDFSFLEVELRRTESMPLGSSILDSLSGETNVFDKRVRQISE